MSEDFKVEIVNPEKSFLVKEDVSEVVVDFKLHVYEELKKKLKKLLINRF